MAAIDKTYVSSYEEWKEVIDWAKETSYTCPNGIVFNVINYCYGTDLSEDEVKEWISESGEIPVMNTPSALDYFLIKYCPLEIIQNRMREVYNKEYISSVLSGTSGFDTYTRPKTGKHIKIIKKPKFKKPDSWFNNYYGIKIKGFYRASVRGCGYNRIYDTWISDYELGWVTSYGSVDTNARSLKALIRKIKSWNLPIGTIVDFYGRYKGEEGRIIIKK